MGGHGNPGGVACDNASGRKIRRDGDGSATEFPEVTADPQNCWEFCLACHLQREGLLDISGLERSIPSGDQW